MQDCLEAAFDLTRSVSSVSELINEDGRRAGEIVDRIDFSPLGEVVLARDETYFDDLAFLLSVEQGAPLVATLGDTSNSLQSEIEPEIENELLGRGLRTATPMVLGMGINILPRRPRRVWAGVAGKEPLRTPRRSVVGCGDTLGWRSSMKNYE